jgi:hypothetical protein
MNTDTDTNTNELEIELVKPGTYNGSSTVTFTRADLYDMMANHARLGLRVPLVIGHVGFTAGDAQPQVGQLKSLEMRGDKAAGNCLVE